MPALKHIHSYEKDKVFKGHYRCVHPACSSHQHKDSLRGKEATCAGCGSVFILGGYHFKRRTPKCDNCTNTREAIARRTAKSAVEDVLREVNLGFDPTASLPLPFSQGEIIQVGPEDSHFDQSEEKKQSVLGLLNSD